MSFRHCREPAMFALSNAAAAVAAGSLFVLSGQIGPISTVTADLSAALLAVSAGVATLGIAAMEG
jgi:hypothetical protein